MGWTNSASIGGVEPGMRLQLLTRRGEVVAQLRSLRILLWYTLDLFNAC